MSRPPPAAAARAATPGPVLSPALAAFALALLLGLQPATTDIYLPALPLLTRELGATLPAAQLTLSALILAFGLAQLVWGPVSDRFGRRPVLLAALAAYAVASMGSTLAPHIEALIVWRALQGATMAAAIVCARAMLRDLYEPHEGARVMSLALSGLGVVAVGGPLLGGVVAAAWGWRAALGVVAATGALALAFVAWRVPETLRERNPDATRLQPLLRQWALIARHPVFVAWALLVSCSYGGLFTILAGSSFVFMVVLGLGPAAYGAAMASNAAAYFVGTFVCRRWIARHGVAGAVARGGGLTLAGGMSIVALALAGVHAAWAVLLPQWLFSLGHGVHQPCGQAGAVGPFPRAAGSASALAGFMLAATAFAIGLGLGHVLDDSVLPYALMLGFWSLATTAVAWSLVQRQR